MALRAPAPAAAAAAASSAPSRLAPCIDQKTIDSLSPRQRRPARPPAGDVLCRLSALASAAQQPEHWRTGRPA